MNNNNNFGYIYIYIYSDCIQGAKLCIWGVVQQVVQLQANNRGGGEVTPPRCQFIPKGSFW